MGVCLPVQACVCASVCVCVYVRAPYFFQYCMMMYLLPVQKLARIWHPISNIFLDIFNKTARFGYTSCKEINFQTLLQFLSCQFQMYRTFWKTKIAWFYDYTHTHTHKQVNNLIRFKTLGVDVKKRGEETDGRTDVHLGSDSRVHMFD